MKYKAILAVVLLAAMLLSSCGGNDEPAQETTTTTTQATQATTTTSVAVSGSTTTAPTTTTTGTTVVQEPQYGGTFTYLYNNSGSSIATMDPVDRQWSNNQYNGYFMEQLISGDLDNTPRGTYKFQTRMGITSNQFGGELAESWEWVDSNTLVFHIRKGVNFPAKENVMASRELKAKDVEFALNRYKNAPKTQGTASIAWIDTITATGTYEVTIKAKFFDPDWAYYIGWGYYVFIYPEELVNAPNGGITNWKNATGTGPFKLADYVFQSMITYTKNEQYWGKTKINGKEYQLPFVNKIQIPIVADAATRIAALRTGKVDLYDFVSWTNVDNLKNEKNLIKVDAEPSTSLALYLRVDGAFGKTPLSDVRVRRALALGLDNPGYLQLVYNNDGVILNAPFQPGWGEEVYTPIEKLPADVAELFTLNIDKAKQLLTEAGYPSGFTTSITGAVGYSDNMALLASMWEKIGVKCEVVPVESTLLNSAYINADDDKKKPYNILVSAATTVSGENAIAQYAHRGVRSHTGWKDPYVEEQYEKIITTTNDVERLKMVKEVGIYWLGQAVLIPLPMMNNHIYYYPWVKNYYGEIQVGAYKSAPVHARLWIDQTLKKKMGY